LKLLAFDLAGAATPQAPTQPEQQPETAHLRPAGNHASPPSNFGSPRAAALATGQRPSIALGHAPTDLLPDDPEIRGLLALMLVNYSRRQARFRAGEPVPPAEHSQP